jgi:general nucleoside transport system ATP-binding protein
MSAEQPIAVEMRGITKRFPGVLANQAVDLTVRTGEIHALLGENGAGKSTLMNVLCGLYHPDEGAISLPVDGRLQQVALRSPRHAIEMGVGMVHQHFKLVRTLSVAENVIVGLAGTPFRLDMSSIEAEIGRLADRYHLPVDPQALIWQLSVGEQQRVEILKVLTRGAHLLILDEPTAVLTPQESHQLGTTLRSMAQEGKAVVFISHKLDEVIAFADRVTVLRDGRNVATLDVAGTSKGELAQLMVGRELASPQRHHQPPGSRPLLELRGASALSDRGMPALIDVDLTVREGEIVGVAGVAGNGQRELAEIVTGLRPLSGGSVRVTDRDLTGRSPRAFIESGVCHIPADRLGTGLAGNLPVSDNLAMKSYRKAPLSKGMLLRRKALTEQAKSLISRFNVMVPGPSTPARNLSGGNQQKAILAREITAGGVHGAERTVLVAAYPTRGLDVGAIEGVRERLAEQRASGCGVLLISEDLDELMAMSDRIAVLHGGLIMGMVEPSSTSIEELGLMMAGERRSA